MVKFRVSESIVIDASMKDVFGVVKDFNTWEKWSPWALLEPEAERTVEMTKDGVGSFQYWNGKLTGEGTIEHTAIKENEMIDQEIAFLKPYKSTDRVWWDFKEVGDGIEVTWNMLGSLPFFMFFLKKKMAAWIGMDYKRGLGLLKFYIEKGEITAKNDFNGIVEFGGQTYMGVGRECTLDGIADSMTGAFSELMDKVNKSNVEVLGPPIAGYLKYDMVKEECEYFAAVPVKEYVDAEGLQEYNLPVLECLKTTSYGPYEFLGNAWAANMMRLRPMKKRPHKKYVGFEVYVNDPNEVDADDLITEVFVPVR